MIDHISSYTVDFPTTKSFYEQAFEPLGYSVQTEMVATWDAEFPTRRICAFGPPGKPAFWVIETQEAATPRHIAFLAPNRKAAAAFHAAGLAAGGQDNGAPGLRPMYHADYFGAFLLDPDGNGIEAVCHQPE